jgi:PAS domain S-box-containing protein
MIRIALWFNSTRITLILVCVAVLGGIGAAGRFYFEHRKAELARGERERVAAIAELQARRIADWYKERFDDANALVDAPLIDRQVRRLLDGSLAADASEQLQAWMASLLRRQNYARVSLLDLALNPRLSRPEGGRALTPAALELAREALAKRQVLATDLHKDPGDDAIHLELLVPLFRASPPAEEKDGRTGSTNRPVATPLAVVVLGVDPEDQLYPLVYNWPVPTRTGESLLVRREGDEVVFLSNLRYRTNTALQLRLPLAQRELPAAAAARGEHRLIEGIDYRGVPVLAATAPVPGTSWGLVAKVDQAEVYAPIRQRAQLITLIVGILAVAGGLGGWGFRQRREGQLIRRELTLAQRLHSILRQANDVILLTDGQWRILEANDRATEAYGYTQEELLRLTLRDLREPTTLTDFDARAKQLATQKSLVAESVHRRKDGSVFPVETSARRVEIDGQVRHQLIIRDLSARRRAERALRDSEERYRLLFESDVMGTLFGDVHGNIKEANERFLRIVGYTREDLASGRLRWTDLTPAEFVRLDQQAVAEARQRGACTPYEKQYLRKDGSRVWVLVGFVLVGPAREESVAFILDLTERKRADETIREQARLLDLASDAIFEIGLDGHVRHWNKGAERLYGWTAPEAIGKPIEELVRYGPGSFVAARAKLDETGEWTGELETAGRDSKPVVTNSRWTRVPGTASKPPSVLVIDTDITDRKRLEAQFLRAQRLESVGILAGGVAHDLNNILAPILMSADLLRLAKLGGELDPVVETVAASARRGADIIKQLLTFARGLQGRRTPVQPRYLVQELVKIIRETFPKSIRVEMDADTRLWLVNGDSTQLHQVLLNLSVNARDAMPNGGVLELTATNVQLDAGRVSHQPGVKPGPFVRLAVTDTGTGILPQWLDRIFDPFFTTKDPGRGTGLGLSTSLGIVRSHGGFIEVQSQVGKGTCFAVYLPALLEAPSEQAARPEEEPPGGQGELILVVDDEHAVRDVIQSTLTRYGYKVLVAADGTEAVPIYVAHQERVRLVLTDVMMPNMDGLTLFRALSRITPNPLAIAMTGMSSETEQIDQVTQLRALGVRTVLSKPFTSRSLLDALRAALDGSGTEFPSPGS